MNPEKKQKTNHIHKKC